MLTNANLIVMLTNANLIVMFTVAHIIVMLTFSHLIIMLTVAHLIIILTEKHLILCYVKLLINNQSTLIACKAVRMIGHPADHDSPLSNAVPTLGATVQSHLLNIPTARTVDR